MIRISGKQKTKKAQMPCLARPAARTWTRPQICTLDFQSALPCGLLGYRRWALKIPV